MRLSRTAVTALLLLSACAKPPGQGGPTTGPDPETQRLIGVYVAVLQEQIGAEAEAGAPPTYVLDRAVSDAADPGATEEEGEPIPKEVQRGVLEAFPGRDIRFIPDGDAVTIPLEEGTGGGVEGGGSLITLGPIPAGEAEVEVAAGSYCGGLCGMWATYVVKLQGDAWKVTGTTGPVAIS